MKTMMKRIVALALAAMLLLPAVSLGEAAYDDEIEAILSGMTLEEKVGQIPTR